MFIEVAPFLPEPEPPFPVDFEPSLDVVAVVGVVVVVVVVSVVFVVFVPFAAN